MRPRSRIFSYRMALADEHIKLLGSLSIHIRSAEINGVFHNGVGLLLKIKRKQLICWLNLLSSVEFVGRGHACMAFIKNCMCTVHTHITRDGLVIGGSIPLKHRCGLGSNSYMCV